MTGEKLLVVIHHSYIPHVDCGAGEEAEAAAVRSMDRYHREQGWGGIGYNWLGFQSGNVYEGRGWGRTGAHTVGRNSSSYGVCLVIDGTEHAPTRALIESVEAVIRLGVDEGFISAAHVRKPHDAFQNKDCPGRLVKASGLLTVNRPLPDVSGEEAIRPRPTLRLGKGGREGPADIVEAVRELQRLLGLEPRHRTGYFGPITDTAVRAFQDDEDLLVDGVVGPKTWAALY